MILHPIKYNQGLIWVDKTAVAPIDFSKLNYQENNGLVFNEENLKSFGAVYEIIAVSNLNLPDTPSIEIEEDINDLAYQYYTSSQYHDITSSYHWLNGYKAASAKKYTEEDLRKAIRQGEINEGCTAARKTDEEFIQSLQPKPVSVEIDMYNGNTGDFCEYWKDGKTFLKVKKVNYES